MAENLISGFRSEAPDKAWVGDITYLRTREGWLYLAVVIDLFSRKVVGWAMEETLSRELATKALRMTISARGPGPGLIAHTGRGSQYASNEYQNLLKLYGAICSMSRKGNCWDNSVAESFFGTLKQEHVFFCDWATRDEDSVLMIEGWYNGKRLHSTLGNCSPDEYERAARIVA